MENFRTTPETNVVGVQAVTQAFLPLLKIGSKRIVINMSSNLGSHGFLVCYIAIAYVLHAYISGHLVHVSAKQAVYQHVRGLGLTCSC